ncbi:MAG: DUF4351 domain-containing protein [Chthonomonadaceae bacterium]|nr:DUF4351 domain-containing protein [Chthonomonadaceae bacterium]
MPYDQLLKETLKELFQEFLFLFYPEIAHRLDLTRITFLDKETFTDFPEGSQREADLVAQVFTLEGEPEILLIHVEVEAEKRSAFRARMFEYYSLFRLRERLPIFPIVIYLSPGAGGLTEETYTQNLFGKEILRFTYPVIGLRDLSADDYLESNNPLASGLSALMRVGQEGAARQKFLTLKKVATSGENEARKFLLSNLVETYLVLEDQEKRAFEHLLETEETGEVQRMISVYEERGIKKGIAQGELLARSRVILEMLQHKFGEVPAETRTKIESLSSPEELDRLILRVLDVDSLTEFETGL